MEQSGAGVRLMLVDACRNDPGKAGGRSARRGVTAGAGPRPPEGVAVLFSCSRGQYSHEHADLKHGIFFHYVLEGLKGKARDDEGAVTWDSLSAFVKREVTRAIPRLVGPDVQQSPNEIKEGAGAPPVLIRPDRTVVDAVTR